MSDKRTQSLFLERKGYRQRRLRDVARMLPVLGGILWTIPLMWRQQGEEAVSNATALQYIFCVWVLVIGLTAVVARLTDTESDLIEKEGGP